MPTSTQGPQPDLYGICVARHWLDTCTTTHDRCNKNVFPNEPDASWSLPRRLLDVGPTGTKSPKLVNSDTLSDDKRYITLSHCWGDASKILKTTLSNLQAHFAEIPWHSLSKTFQDSIIVTQLLGYRYLWIDSLAIIQDSRDDFEVELGRMHTIYLNGHVMISASDAASGEEGFLRYWDRDRTSMSFRGNMAFDKSAAAQFRIGEEIFYQPWTHYLSGPLGRRGWTCQERQLAPRILHYTLAGVLWECRDCIGAGDLTRLQEREDNTGVQVPEGMTRVLDRTPARDSLNMMVFWLRLIDDYTGRKLSFPGDKLPAISAIAAIIPLLHHDTVKYLIGLWVCDLATQLCWFSTSGMRRNPDYPSWTWAAHDGPISYSYIQHKGKVLEPNSNFKYLSSDIKPSRRTLYGSFTGERLDVYGQFEDLEGMAIADRNTGKSVQLDYKATVLAELDLTGLRCLFLLHGDIDNRPSEAGILLRRTEGEVFERIGTFWNWPDVRNNNSPSRSGEEASGRKLGKMSLV